MKGILKLVFLLVAFITLADADSPSLSQMQEACGILQPGGNKETCFNLDKEYQANGYSCCHVYFKLDIMEYNMCKLIKKEKGDIKDFKKDFKSDYDAADVDIDCGCNYFKYSVILIFALAFFLF